MSVKVNMPTLVKKMRKAIDAKKVDIFESKNVDQVACMYSPRAGKSGCIIGVGLTPKQKAAINKDANNESNIETVISHKTLDIPAKYHSRLILLQEAHDNYNKKALRSRFRHLEASVKKDFPKSFTA